MTSVRGLLWLAALAAPGLVWADHPTQGARSGVGPTGWLFVAGVVAILAMIAWALLAPSGDEPDDTGRSR